MHKLWVFFSAALLALSSSACTTVSAVSPHALSHVVEAGPRGHAIRVAGVERKQVKISPKSKLRIRRDKKTSPWVKACDVRVNGEGLEIAGMVHSWKQLDAIDVKNPDTGKTFAAIVGAIFVAAAVVGTAAAVSGKSKGKRRRVKSRRSRRSRSSARVRARAPASSRARSRVRAPAASSVKSPSPRVRVRAPRAASAPKASARSAPRIRRTRRARPRYAALRHRTRPGVRVGVAVDIPLYVDDGVPPPPAPICEPGLPCGPPPPSVAQAVDVEEERPTPHPALPFHPLFSRRLCR